MKWQKCRDIPIGTACAQAVVVRGIVYVGGGYTLNVDDRYIIQHYSPTDDKWSALPPAPVHFFGVGELNGQLVIVGGKIREDVTGKVHTFDNSSQKWKKSIPPMPTARYRPAVFSQPSCLTVVGGRDQRVTDTSLSDVEIFIPYTSQWHKSSPAPSPLYNMSTTFIYDQCFLSKYNSNKVYQLYVSMQQEKSGSSITPQVTTEWKIVPDLPLQRSALGIINKCLLAVGGLDRGSIVNTFSAFSPITNTWKIVGELPEPRESCCTVLLPTGELLVMGGMDGPSSRTRHMWRAALF